MKYLTILLIFTISIKLSAQEIKSLNPTIEQVRLYSTEEQKEWYEIISLYKQLEKGQINYENDLSFKQKELIDSIEGGLGPFTEGVSCSWYCGGGPCQINNLKLEIDSTIDNYEFHNVHDFNLLTSYEIALKSRENKIDFYFKRDSPRMNAIVIWNGNQENENQWSSYSRVKTIKLFINNQPKYLLQLEDTPDKQIFNIEELEQIALEEDLKITFEILKIYKGLNFKIASLSEINFDGRSH